MSTKPLQFFKYSNGVLQGDGVRLDQLAEEVGTPAYVYSSKGFLEPLAELQKGLEGLDHLICFAVKANSNIGVLRLLGSKGAGMDVVSGGELHRALAAGVPAGRIVFSGVGKTRDEMLSALRAGKNGIHSFNVESLPELAQLSAVAGEIGRPARVALRFNPDVDPKTHPYISTGLKKNKFGLSRAEVLSVARAPEEYPGIQFRGISIHIGSQLLSLKPLEDAFRKTRLLITELAMLLPRPLEFVDVGGGVGIRYRNEATAPIERYTWLIKKHFGVKPGQQPLRVLLEPGRVIAGNAGVLLTRVLYRKSRAKKDFIIVDAAMNDLIRPALYGSHHDVAPVHKLGGKTKKSDLVGPVCESSDCFASDRSLPTALGPGDLLAILSSGAYGFSMASNYNSRPKPPEVLIQGGGYKIIRERETLDDLIRGEHS